MTQEQTKIRWRTRLLRAPPSGVRVRSRMLFQETTPAPCRPMPRTLPHPDARHPACALRPPGTMLHTIANNRRAVPSIGSRLGDKLWSRLIKGLIFFQQMRQICVRTADRGITQGSPKARRGFASPDYGEEMSEFRTVSAARKRQARRVEQGLAFDAAGFLDGLGPPAPCRRRPELRRQHLESRRTDILGPDLGRDLSVHDGPPAFRVAEDVQIAANGVSKASPPPIEAAPRRLTTSL